MEQLLKQTVKFAQQVPFAKVDLQPVMIVLQVHIAPQAQQYPLYVRKEHIARV
jgi:hypothetical protein